jgi:hypothetical protein
MATSTVCPRGAVDRHGDRPARPVSGGRGARRAGEAGRQQRAAQAVVGNPIIADVSLQRNGVVVLTGKSFGSTNLIALDCTAGRQAGVHE